MPPEIVSRQGSLAGERFGIGAKPLTFGRKSANDVVIRDVSISRFHAEVRREGHGFMLYDLGSSNGTYVNGERMTSRVLQPDDVITIGEETFSFEAAGPMETIMDLSVLEALTPPPAEQPVPVLKVTVSGGGPVGLAFALLLESLLGPRAAVTIYDGRWTRDGDKVVWKDATQGNVRRMQVVTVQSRQYLGLPQEVQDRLFKDGAYSEMWPAGPDSIRGHQPRNIRISYVEDTLLEMANEKPDRIRLVPERFDPVEHEKSAAADHVLAICEGAAPGRANTSARSSAVPTRPSTRWKARTSRTWCSA